MTCRILALAVLLLAAPASVSAEWQLKPFLGLTFGGGTTLRADLEHAVGERNLTYGGSALLLGDVLGVEVDFSHAPGFFEAGDQSLVLESRATTLSGSVVVALPRRLAEYTLRPYVVGGLGMLRLRSEDFFDLFPLADRRLAVVVGAGVTGFLTERLGVNWDLRHFRRVPGGDSDPEASTETAELSFWRGTTGVVFRF